MYRFIHTTVTFLLLSLALYGQDSLDVSDLAEHTYHFTIDKGQFNGQGADFLAQEIDHNQYFLLGEYHNSPQISKLTEALLPTFSAAGGRHFALEVGPVSAGLLSEFAYEPSSTADNLHALNTEHLFPTIGSSYVPIPFFRFEEDAAFLGRAGELRLELIGLDQEFIFGFGMLLQRAEANLSIQDREEFGEELNRAADTLQAYYEKERLYYNREKGASARLTTLIHNSRFLNGLFVRLEATGIANREIVEALRFSNEVYRQSTLRHYWNSNELRTKNLISNLRKGMIKSEFSLEKDKMFIKIGGLHTARGLNNYSMFDVGNTVAELARFYGNSSVHTTFFSRYVMEGDRLIDYTEEEGSWEYKNFRAVLLAGKKEEWTVIDLRPLRNAFYYQQKFLTTEWVKLLFDRYDLIVIPPLDRDEGTLNYFNPED